RRDGGGDADGPQIVDDRLLQLRVAGRGRKTSAEAEVRRREVPSRTEAVDLFKARDDVRGVGENTWGGALAIRGFGEFGENLNRHELRAFRHARERGTGTRAVAGRDAGDVGTVPAGAQWAIHARAGPDLLILAVGAQGHAVAGHCARETGFFHYLA